MKEDVRIGVFVCHCGQNIAKSVDCEAVADYAAKIPQVVYSTHYEFMCSEEGQQLIREKIKEHKLNRVVVASCSPKLHEELFRRVVEEAGLNSFLFEMANIREHCSWAHIREPEFATQKAKHLVRAAIERAKTLEEIGKTSVSIEPTALVIGGGMAGTQAAMELAERGFDVHIVERKATLGGTASQLGEVFLTGDCGICLPPVLPEMHRRCMYKTNLALHPRISLHTLSTVEDFKGHVGNFEATIRKEARYIDEKACILCGRCEEVCPVEVPNERDLGLSTRKAVYLPFPQAIPHSYVIDGENCSRCGECEKVCPTKAIDINQQVQHFDLKVGAVIVATGFEEFKPFGFFGFGEYENVITQLMLSRMLDPSGPTGGRVIRPSDGKAPDRVTMIQCVGSRDPQANPHCSKICCMIALKHAKSIRERCPSSDVTICFEDIRLAGRDYESYYTDSQEQGVGFLRGNVVEVSEDQNTHDLKLRVSLLSGGSEELETGLLILSSAMVPSEGSEKLARTLGLSIGPSGFFTERHPKLAPLDTSIDGIYLCGACQGPKDIPESITQAMGAASRASILLKAGEVEVDLAKAAVNEDLCIGCGRCATVCPYSAIEIDPSGKASVIEASCKGCGVCTAECPTKAIQLRHFKDNQILAAIDGILAEGD